APETAGARGLGMVSVNRYRPSFTARAACLVIRTTSDATVPGGRLVRGPGGPPDRRKAQGILRQFFRVCDRVPIGDARCLRAVARHNDMMREQNPVEGPHGGNL